MPTRNPSEPFEQQYKEWFSRAFLQAASAAAGVAAEWVQNDVFGVDAVLRKGGISVDVQLKATSSAFHDGDGTQLFDLEASTYNSLVSPERLAPAYLIVASIEATRSDWLSHSSEMTGLRRHARWVKLSGLMPTANQTSIRLRLPATNILTPEAIVSFIAEARGEWS